MMKRYGVFIGLFTVTVLTAAPATAGLTLCNRTSYVLYAATASLNVPDLTVKGWTRLVPGGCAEAIKGDLNAQQYFITAKTSRAHSGPPRNWNGPTTICAKDADFSSHIAFGARCPADAAETGFAPVDTKHMRNWTATFRDSPDVKSMADAERAGLKRLLGDTGAKQLSTDKQVNDALGAFKARAKLAKTASTGAVFDALETEAMKTAVPTGYTLCNDSSGPVYAALGLQNGTVYTARGWWTVAGGTCAPLVTDSVAGKKVWLRVERGKGPPLVQGAAKFCVTNIEFDIQGRDRCAQRGLTEAGFAETHGGPAPGFTAHVTATGLSPK